jgi:hypothetical protein
VLRDVLGRLDRTGVLRDVLGRLDRTGALRVVTERLVVERVGIARRVVVVLRVGVAWRVGVARRVVDVTRVGEARRVVVVWPAVRRDGCCAVALTVRRVASVVLRAVAVAVRAVGVVLGLSTVRRPPLAVTRVGVCRWLRLAGAKRLALADAVFAADARLTEEPIAPAYTRLPRLVLFDGRTRVRDVLRSLLSPYTTTVGLR